MSDVVKIDSCRTQDNLIEVMNRRLERKYDGLAEKAARSGSDDFINKVAALKGLFK